MFFSSKCFPSVKSGHDVGHEGVATLTHSTRWSHSATQALWIHSSCAALLQCFFRSLLRLQRDSSCVIVWPTFVCLLCAPLFPNPLPWCGELFYGLLVTPNSSWLPAVSLVVMDSLRLCLILNLLSALLMPLVSLWRGWGNGMLDMYTYGHNNYSHTNFMDITIWVIGGWVSDSKEHCCPLYLYV